MVIQEPGETEIVVVILANIMIKKGDQAVKETTILRGPGKEATIILDTMGDIEICVVPGERGDIQTIQERAATVILVPPHLSLAGTLCGTFESIPSADHHI